VSGAEGGALEPPTFALPPLFDAAEKVSASSQKIFLRTRSTELMALVIAALLGVVPNNEAEGLAAVIAVVAFGLALMLRVGGFGERAEKRWYSARAAAESIKSASWQFAVGGESFRVDDPSAEGRYRSELRQILETLPHLDVPVESGTACVTDDMLKLRSSARENRVHTYRGGRVLDQLSWYSRKAKWNQRRASVWRWALVAGEAGAVVFGIFRVRRSFDVDWVAVFAAVAAGVAAWIQIKNFSSLSEAYSITSHEVQLLNESMSGRTFDEGEWATAVHDAEAAFSREHTMWLARRQGPRPVADD
jgi:hypothetical protein